MSAADRTHRQDRVAGVLTALAAGDALGAGYELQPPTTGPVAMIGGGLGGFAPGEWTDDTAMAVAVAEVTATGLLDAAAVGDGFLAWYRDGPKDVGIATRAVLSAATDGAGLAAAAARYLARTPRGGAGNGALMRTAPVALLHLGDDTALAEAAREVAELTHADPLAGDACVLWCVAIDRAVREDRLDGVHDGLGLLPAARRARWEAVLEQAETGPPGRFAPNGFTVPALQAAYAAVRHTPIPVARPGGHLAAALEAAVRIGDDTDTVAAIAGALLGARWGTSAVPLRWLRALHGWRDASVLPARRDARAGELVRLALRSAGLAQPAAPLLGGGSAAAAPGVLQPLPGDAGLLLGDLAAVAQAGSQVDVVVSLCPVDRHQLPPGPEHLEVWLADDPDPAANPHLEQVVDDTVALLLELRAAGQRVLLHGRTGTGRSCAVAACTLAAQTGLTRPGALQVLAEASPELDPARVPFAARLGLIG